MSTRILIIEDDLSLRVGIEDNLQASGYETASAKDGLEGLKKAYIWKADLIILDIMLPSVNGYEICQSIRCEGIETPVLMLTAKDQNEDIVRGLELGADDYLVKPFALPVLLARIRALLRRHSTSQVNYQFADIYTLNSESRKLLKSGKEIALTPKEFDLLYCFLSHSERALSREKIISDVWGNGLFVTHRSVDRCVKTLRSKLGEECASRLKTVRGIGYRWEEA